MPAVPDPLFPLSGIAEIDAAHGRLQAQLRETQRALAQASLSEAMVSAVTLLMALRENCRGEELLMSKFGYSRKAIHQYLHTLIQSKFVELVHAIRDTAEPPPEGARARLLELLASASRRLVAHVEQEDIPLARFIQAASGNSRGSPPQIEWDIVTGP